MRDFKKNDILYLLVGTLVVTGLIGVACYFIYGIEIAIISIFGSLLGFTIVHIVLFYFWVSKRPASKDL